MSTFGKLRTLETKYNKKLKELRASGDNNNSTDVLEQLLEEISEVSTYASWENTPTVRQGMGQ